MMKRRGILAAALTAGAVIGCVERTVTITTDPEGATVYLNDEEIGQSPVKTNYTWYGDYDIVIRKPGYQTLQTNHRLHAPWYQWPVIDLFAECLVPVTIHDDRVLPTYALEPAARPTKEALLESAEELRTRALTGAD